MRHIRLLTTLLAFLAAATGAICAEPKAVTVELSQPVLQRSDVTYLDLARQFVPDLKQDGTGTDNSKLDAIRHVGGPDSRATISSIQMSTIQRIDLPEERQALILFDLGHAEDAAQSVTILALYDLSARPQLLDAMDVGTDLQTSFVEPHVLHLSPKISVGFAGSWHLNAGEEFVSTSIIGIWDRKLHAVDTIWLRNWEGCNTFVKHKLDFRKGRDVALDSVMTVSKRQGSCDDDKSGSVENKRYNVRYGWSAQSHTLVADSSAITEALAAEESDDQ